MKQEHRVRVLVLTLSVMLTHVGATPPLNPLVTRIPEPSATAPEECYESLAPAPMPRVDVASLPEPEVVPASIAAPPSRTLRAELAAAHDALVRNDRPAFDEHLGNARALLAANYPPGAERTAAEDAVRAFDDASRLWDAQFESPFFDETSDAYARASRYPGYADAVRRGMFTDDADRRFYPAAESRDFVAGVAGERLARLGITTPTRIARTERVTRPAPEPTRSIARNEPSSAAPSYSTPSTSSAQRRAPRAGSSSKRRTATASSPSRKKSSMARSSQSVASPGSASTSPDPSASRPAATASAPAAPPAAAPTPSASASPVAVGRPPAAPDPAPSSTTGDVADLPNDTAGTSAAATDTTDTTLATDTARPVVTATDPATDTATAATTPERRSVVVPALLILIGLGVLIVLFRASK